MRKSALCICENKGADQLRGNPTADQQLCGNPAADQHLCFRYEESLYFLHSKFQASSHLLWLYSLVCVRPGLNRFSRDVTHIIIRL